MKKIAVILIIACMCLSFCGCGAETSKEDVEGKTEIEEEIENEQEKESSNNISGDNSELADVIGGLLGSSVDEIECPDFIGEKAEEIIANKEYEDNFEFILKWDHNKEYGYGIVYEQSVTEGEKLKKSAEITLYVSMGQSTKKVPDVYGMIEAQAVSELQSNGFTEIVISSMPSEEFEEGLVAKTEPQRTEVVAEGTEITVYISSGKPT